MSVPVPLNWTTFSIWLKLLHYDFSPQFSPESEDSRPPFDSHGCILCNSYFTVLDFWPYLLSTKEPPAQKYHLQECKLQIILVSKCQSDWLRMSESLNLTQSSLYFWCYKTYVCQLCYNPLSESAYEHCTAVWIQKLQTTLALASIAIGGWAAHLIINWNGNWYALGGLAVCFQFIFD